MTSNITATSHTNLGDLVVEITTCTARRRTMPGSELHDAADPAVALDEQPVEQLDRRSCSNGQFGRRVVWGLPCMLIVAAARLVQPPCGQNSVFGRDGVDARQVTLTSATRRPTVSWYRRHHCTPQRV